MSNSTVEPRGAVVQSVDRALALTEILAREGWTGVTDLANELGIHKSTVFRLLATLERRGLVEQHVETQKYRLGFAIVRLANAVRSALDLTRYARPVAERLSESVGETVNLAVLEGQQVVNIDQVNLSPAFVTVNWLGRRTPLHCTSTGKVFLAHAPESVRRDLLADPLERLTPHTITDPDVLRRELDAVLVAGYAHTVQELELGLNAVAAPVRAADGSVLATISVSGPSFRLEARHMDAVGAQTREAAREISQRLGFTGDAAPAA
ncbi:MAG: IclR family transcriptional regulator [Egibacteraceae bacterium]